jgi:hypothetical protein
VFEEKILLQEGYVNQDKDKDIRFISTHGKEKGKCTSEGERLLQPL